MNGKVILDSRLCDFSSIQGEFYLPDICRKIVGLFGFTFNLELSKPFFPYEKQYFFFSVITPQSF